MTIKIERTKVLDKIRALLSKTTANGCTEAEAFAALDKARAMMDAYEVTEADLQLVKTSAASIFGSSMHDPHNIRTGLAVRVAEFCECKVWWDKHNTGQYKFCGVGGDAELATWLLDALATFVQCELVKHLAGLKFTRGERRRCINGFVLGACRRINERLQALIVEARSKRTSNSTALVVAKSAIVREHVASVVGKLTAGRSSTRRMDAASYGAGHAAGDRASFNRPVNGGSKGALTC